MGQTVTYTQSANGYLLLDLQPWPTINRPAMYASYVSNPDDGTANRIAHLYPTRQL